LGRGIERDPGNPFTNPRIGLSKEHLTYSDPVSQRLQKSSSVNEVMMAAPQVRRGRRANPQFQSLQ
jgi:hypothetical protein